MKSFIFVFLALFSSGLIAQNKYFVGVGANASFLAKSYDYMSPTFALHIQRSRSILHSISLSDVFLQEKTSPILYNANNTIISGTKTFRQNYGLTYLFSYFFCTKSPLQMGIGGGTKAYFAGTSNRPLEGSYPNKSYSGGLTGIVSPTLRYLLKDKWMFLLQIPVSVMDFGIESNQIENPSLSFHQQRNTFFNFSALPGTYAIQASINYRIK